MDISIVIPVYKAEKLVDLLVNRVRDSVSKITGEFEIILVEDGSPDKSWEGIIRNGEIDSRIKGIKLSRNFGQHYAITAGLDHAIGQWIVVMDCDLQDQPEEIINLYSEAQKGFDIVVAKRVERKDHLLKRTSSYLFYMVLSYLTGTRQDPSIANFGIYSKRAISALQQLREPIRYFPTMIGWIGFKKTFINVEHAERYSGSTSYNYSKLFRLALDIILANSDKPIRIIVILGFLIAFISFAIGTTVITQYLLHKISVPGYTSLLVSIWFIGGMILCVLGLIGLYIGKIFEGVKNRPLYIIANQANL